jgi:flagellar basal-body rod modification protein FlgD
MVGLWMVGLGNERIIMATSGIGSTTGSSTSSGSSTDQNDALRGLNLDQFLKLMITELQNQDPLNPMDNTQILQQIGEMRQIQSSTSLTDTLTAMTLGQNLTTASGMIGKSVTALTDDGKTITGKVDKVTVTDGVPLLHIGNSTVHLNNVKAIEGEPVGDATGTAAGVVTAAVGVSS